MKGISREAVKLLSNEKLLKLFEEYSMGFETCSDDFEENKICYEITLEELLRRLNVKFD